MSKKIAKRFRAGLSRHLIDPSLMEHWLHMVEVRDSIVYKAATLVAGEMIEGDYLEFGAYIGSSFASAFAAFQQAFDAACIINEWNSEQDSIVRRRLWGKMRFFAFDSFNGLPKLEGIDSASGVFVQGKYSISLEDFLNNISRWGVPLNRTIVVPGWFEETLNHRTIQEHGLKSAAVVHIDSDLYESARLALDFVTPLLVDGTVIIFDDWYNFKGNPNLGERRACREWMESHTEWILSEYQKEGPFRNSFIATKNP